MWCHVYHDKNIFHPDCVYYRRQGFRIRHLWLYIVHWLTAYQWIGLGLKKKRNWWWKFYWSKLLSYLVSFCLFFYSYYFFSIIRRGKLSFKTIKKYTRIGNIRVFWTEKPFVKFSFIVIRFNISCVISAYNCTVSWKMKITCSFLFFFNYRNINDYKSLYAKLKYNYYFFVFYSKQAVMHVRSIKSTSNFNLTYECDMTTYEDDVNVAHALVFHEYARLVNPRLAVSTFKFDVCINLRHCLFRCNQKYINLS